MTPSSPATTPDAAPRWRLLRRLPPLVGLLLLGAAFLAVRREFRHLSLDQIRDSMLSIPPARLLEAGGCTLLSYLVLSFYDTLAVVHVGRRLSFGRTALAAFCSYVLSHNLGFAAISGAAVRFRLYGSWGLAPGEITRIIAFCSLTYVLGAAALIGGVLLIEPQALALVASRVPPGLLTLAGLAAWALVGLYVAASVRLPRIRIWRWTVPLPGPRMAIGQIVVAAAEVAATAAIAYALLPHETGLGYPAFLALYIAAYSAGLLSSVPGGLGVFDGAMILGLSPFVPSQAAVVAILVFRLFYYIVPLFIAGLLFAGHELFLRGDTMLSGRRPGRRAAVRPSQLIRENEADFSVSVAAGAVVLCGAMLLARGLLQPDPDLAFALPPPGLPLGLDAPGGFGWFIQAAGDYVPSLIGAALIGLAIGLSQRVTLAWGATLVLLCLATALTALSGSPPAVPGVLILSALLVAPFRASYYRHARLLSEPLAAATLVPLLLLLACVLILGQLEPSVRSISDNGWLSLVLGRGMTGRMRLSVGLSVAVGLAAIARLVLPARIGVQTWGPETEARYLALGPQPLPGAVPDGLVLGETGRAAIPFRRLGRFMLGLGDPAGAAPDKVATIWRLRDLALQEGREPAFWQVGPQLLDIYADLGLERWPIEDGSGRYLCCAAERGEALLALLSRPEAPGSGSGSSVA